MHGVNGAPALLALIDDDDALRDVSALLLASAGYEVEALAADAGELATVDWDAVDAVVVGLEPRTEKIFGEAQKALGIRVPVVGLSRSDETIYTIEMEVLLERPVAFDQILAAVRDLVADGGK